MFIYLDKNHETEFWSGKLERKTKKQRAHQQPGRESTKMSDGQNAISTVHSWDFKIN